MFEVRLWKLKAGEEGLEKIAVRQGNFVEEMAEVRAKLSSLSGMDGILRRLGKVERDVERQKENTKRLAEGLKRVHSCYLQTEKTIIERVK